MALSFRVCQERVVPYMKCTVGEKTPDTSLTWTNRLSITLFFPLAVKSGIPC